MKRPTDEFKEDLKLLGVMLALIFLLAAEGASAGLINHLKHTDGFDSDPKAVQIHRRVAEDPL